MPSRPPQAVSRQIEALFEGGSVAGLPDGALLERFLAADRHRAERAFEALVTRHGPLVRGVCRRIVADPTDADDAFQATFLVLVRRAGSVRVDDSLGRWLAGVARRVAARVRADRERRLRRERSGGVTDREAGSVDLPSAEVLRALDAEVARLGEPFRSAVVLCDLGGRTHEQAALDLGCPVGTVKSRLARGRARLKARLTRRGFDGPLGLALVGPAHVAPRLVEATVRLALAAVDPGSPASWLAWSGWFPLKNGVARMMFTAPTQWVAGTALMVAMGATSLVWVAEQTSDTPPAPTQSSGKQGNAPKTFTSTPAGEPFQESQSLIRSKKLAVQHFGPDAWMTKDIKLTYYDASLQIYMYTEGFELNDGGKRMTVSPFAMISVSKNGPSHKTITSNKAIITFNQPYGLLKKSAEPTRVVHAELIGDVQIRDDKGTDDLADDLLIGPLTGVELTGKTMNVTSKSGVMIQDDDLRIAGTEMMLRLRHEIPTPAQSGTEPRPKSRGVRANPAVSPPMIQDYVIEPPDILIVEVIDAPPGRPIGGERLVRPDGKISLGSYGEVFVGDLTTTEAKAKIIEHLRPILGDDKLGLHRVEDGHSVPVEPAKSSRVFVEVAVFNSKVYYVQGDVKSPGRLPITGNETVRDAISYAGGIIKTDRPTNVRLIRQALRRMGGEYALPINFKAIEDGTDLTTSYRLLPGDRLVVDRDPITEGPQDRPGLAAGVRPPPAEPAADRTVARVEAPSPPAPTSVDPARLNQPRESEMVALPPHVVEPPDIIRVKAPEVVSGQPIGGEFLVQPDGMINLGYYGRVSVAGLTTEQIETKIIEHLESFLRVVKPSQNEHLIKELTSSGEVKSHRVQVDVTAYNSRNYYVLGDVRTPGRLPTTGRDTVLDALVYAGGGTGDLADAEIRLIRPQHPPGVAQTFRVDWKAIVNSGDSSTNYQIFAGDRIHVVNKTQGIASGSIVSPPERDARPTPESARLDELERKLDLILKKLEGDAKP